MRFRRPKLRIQTAAAMALVVTAVVAASMSVAPRSTALAQSSGICDRTQEVRDAILTKLSDVSDCANVTDSHLAGITGDLTLSNESISALKAGDFKGLTGLGQLYLDNNNLSDLPDGIFAGLESLDTLWLNFNTGSPFSLTMTLEQEGSNSVVVKVAEGAPFDMEITLSAEGGTLSSTTVTVEGGSLKSEAVSVSPSDQSRVQTADVQVTVSVESSDFSATDYSNYFGLKWEEADDLELTLAAPPGICGRTQEVQDAILALLSDVSDCADVTDTHLAGITKLVVSFTSATSIKSGDFAGLSSMTWLQPTGSSYIRSVPKDVFEGLGNLQRLYLFLGHHGASNVFTFDIRFSEDIPLSYKTLKFHAFTVTGGSILKAQRMDKPSNIKWRIMVRPDSSEDVTIVLPATTDCEAQGAVCTGDGRKLSNSLVFTVSGPVRGDS